MTSLHFALFLCVFVAMHQLEEGLAMRMEIYPEKYDGLIVTAFTISCRPELQSSCAKDILSIKAYKDDERFLASIQRNSEIKYNKLLATVVKAKGRLDDNFRESELNVTFPRAMQEDSGAYSCMAIYLDDQGRVQQEVTTKNLTVDGHSMPDTVHYLMEKMASMQKQLEHQKTELARVAIHTNNGSSSSLPRGSPSSITSGFHAGYASGFIRNGQTIVFGDELLDVNGDHDTITGVFKAPTKGLYVFHLVLATDRDKGMIEVDLKANDRVVATLEINDKDYMHQSSVSALVTLKVGDEVKAVVRRVFGSFVRNNLRSNDHYSVFTGYLLKSL